MGGSSSTVPTGNPASNASSLAAQLAKLTPLPGDPGRPNLVFLVDPSTNRELLLRDITVPNPSALPCLLETLEARQSILDRAPHLLPISGFSVSTSLQFCSSVSKVSVLCEHPQRTLDDETAERHLQKRLYSEKELWTVVASCILAFAYLQKHEVRHQCVRSSQVFVEATGLIKVADPFVDGALSNWECLRSRRKDEHCYLAPELVAASPLFGLSTNLDVYKSDVYSFGMVVLEAGLLEYQDECYGGDGIDPVRVSRNLGRFGSLYSEDMTRVLVAMLHQSPLERESWLELERYVRVLDESQHPPNKASSKQNLPEGGQTRSGGWLSEQTPLSSFQLTFKPPDSEQPRPKKGIVRVSPAKPERLVTSVHPALHAINLPYSHIRQSPSRFLPPKAQGKTLSPQKIPTMGKPQQAGGVPTSAATRANEEVKARGRGRTERESQMTLQTLHQEGSSLSPPPTSSRLHPCRLSPTMHQRSAKTLRPQFVVEHFKQGSRYEGYKLEGMRHGRGRFYYQDGGMYDGEWAGNTMTGQGRLYYQSGRLAYEGGWLHDNFNGQGVLWNEAPSQLPGLFDYRNFDDVDNCWVAYDGNFAGDLKEGRGRLLLQNGEVYEGDFHEDAVHGQGVFWRANGECVSGYWRQNQLLH